MPDSRPHDPDADSDFARTVAADLLSIGAVTLQPEAPFTWSSGFRSPIYCDNRRTMSFPRVRTALRDGFVRCVEAHDLAPATIVGTATAGIPHAAWLADRLDAPMAYVRSEPKSHGQMNQIEGIVETGDDVIVVEDLISTGSSALNAVDVLRSAGATVQAVFAIFSYELDAAARAFRDADVSVHTLSTFRTLVDVAHSRDELTAAQAEILADWRDDPEAWSDARTT